MNTAATDELVRVVTVGGEECLHVASMRFDVALIRATTADSAGNLTMEHEPASLTAFAQATAAKASGGIVIAQVKRTLSSDTLKPHEVKVPGSLVDFIVVEPEPLQAGGIRYDPSISGEVRTSVERPLPGNELDRYLARRAMREVRPNDVVVLGYGVSAIVPYLMKAEGRFDEATFTVEQGSHGGLPLTDFGFGSSYNPRAILDSCSQFDLFQGGCFDLALLSFLQIDERGRINVHRLDARPALSAGIGGFLDIAANAPRLVIIGSFNAGGVKLAVEGDALRIVQEGRMRKFVKRLDHVSYDPAVGRNREVLYVTERATFRLAGGGLTLVEIAPGIDPGRDVLAHMEFSPRVELPMRPARNLTALAS